MKKQSDWKLIRHACRVVVLLAAFCLFASAVFMASAGAKPNIVLIVSADQGYGDSSGNWKTDLQTPFMDEIGRNGIRFTQFRVNPLCAPTRASLMTGLYSIETGMWRGPGDGEKVCDDDSAKARLVKDDIQFLPKFLKSAGYVTGIFGKWHLGTDAKNVPNVRGFDEFVGFLGGAHPYWIAKNSRLQKDGKPLDLKEGHTTDVFADNAIAFIKTNRARPFFCYVPFNAVHGPLRREDAPKDSAKPEWLEFYRKRGVDRPRRDYNAVMTHADHRAGDILKPCGN